MGLFSKKSITEPQAEAGRGTLKRSLGPVNLTTLGIGSVIGTGIFVLTGTAASQHAGPALVISMVIAAVACAFAGLCYAELASMIPVAGSAYTYAYATAGEIFAWIIGWDLILEYALSTATVAVGWSGYFVSFMRDIGIEIPQRLTASPEVALTTADGAVVHGLFNLPAAIIVLFVAALLTVGIKESANTAPSRTAARTSGRVGRRWRGEMSLPRLETGGYDGTKPAFAGCGETIRAGGPRFARRPRARQASPLRGCGTRAGISRAEIQPAGLPVVPGGVFRRSLRAASSRLTPSSRRSTR